MAEQRHVSTRDSRVPLRAPDIIPDEEEIARLVSFCQRPSLLLSEREISVLRRGLTKRGWKRGLYLEPVSDFPGIYCAPGLLDRAEKSLENGVDIPEPGGRWEDFHCKCGAPLSLPHDLRTAAHYECTICGKQRGGPACDGAVRFYQHVDAVGKAMALALVHSAEKKDKCAAKVAEILMGYADCCSAGAARTGRGRIVEKPQEEAALVVALAQAYDLIYYHCNLSSARREILENILFRQTADALSRQPRQGAWSIAATGTVGFVLRDSTLVAKALHELEKFLINDLGEDGLLSGPLVGMHYRSLSALVHFAEACYRAGIDLYDWEPAPGKSLKAMFAAPMGCAYPSFRLPAIDGDPPDSFVPLDIYEVACRRWDDAVFVWALKKGYRFGDSPACEYHSSHRDIFRRGKFYAFLFGRDLPGRVGTPAIGSRSFLSPGLCVLRGDKDSMATLRCGACSKNGHRDKLSFTYYAGGALLIPDFGTPAGGPVASEWPVCASAHNTVLVDGNQLPDAAKAAAVAVEHGHYLRWAEAVEHGVCPGVDHTRQVVLADGLCLIADALTGRSEHDYDWTVHTGAEIRVSGEQIESNIQWKGNPQVTVDRVYDLASLSAVDWAGGTGRVSLGIWAKTADACLAVGTCPAETMSTRASVLICRQRVRSAKFAAVLATSASGEVELTKRGRVITSATPDCTDYVCFGWGEPDASGQRIVSDGQVAAVRVRGSRVLGVAVIRGSYVRWDDDMLIECPSKVDYAEAYFVERKPLITYRGGTTGTVRIKTNARAVRVNGRPAGATNSDGRAVLRITSQNLVQEATGETKRANRQN